MWSSALAGCDPDAGQLISLDDGTHRVRGAAAGAEDMAGRTRHASLDADSESTRVLRTPPPGVGDRCFSGRLLCRPLKSGHDVSPNTLHPAHTGSGLPDDAYRRSAIRANTRSSC